MSKSRNASDQELYCKGQLIKVRSTSAYKTKQHCPYCGGIMEVFNGSSYCETCNIDFDENGRAI